MCKSFEQNWNCVEDTVHRSEIKSLFFPVRMDRRVVKLKLKTFGEILENLRLGGIVFCSRIKKKVSNDEKMTYTH